jgi:8-oxo-dGTP diphosphatase
MARMSAPEEAARRPLLLVVAAVVVRDGRVLLALRPDGVHLAGHWEFPGGKVEPGESPPAALAREIEEELGVAATVEAPFAFNHHAYADREVLLLTWRVTLRGEPRALGCAAIGWFGAAGIRRLPTPPADGPIFAALEPLLAPV